MRDLYSSTGWQEHDVLSPRMRRGWFERNVGTLARLVVVVLLVLLAVSAAHYVRDLSTVLADAMVPVTQAGDGVLSKR